MVKETKKEHNREIPEIKLKTVAELENLIKKNKTFMICSIKGLPGKEYQAIKKKIRDMAKVKVVKKSMVIRAIENSGIEIKKLKDYVKEDSALLFSQTDMFELSMMLSQNTVPVGARIGQISNQDIEIEPGPTDLVPGPVISELGALGLKIAIEDGKISIKEKKVIVRKGETIKEAAVGLMSKLGIKPFSIGFEAIAGYDSEDKKVYKDIKIDQEKTLNDFKSAYGKALAFAVKIAYPVRETIGFLIAKAASHEKAINKISQSPQGEIKLQE